MTRLTDPAQAYTSPENRGVCGFCGKEEGGYAKKDNNGAWHPACWECVKPEKVLPPQKRKPVGTVFHEDLDLAPGKKQKSPGIAPSTYRPKTT